MALGSHTKKAMLRLSTITNGNLDLSWLNIVRLPELMDQEIKGLDISYSNIRTLESLPPTLQSFNCSYTKLRWLPPLPKSLVNLECTHCHNLLLKRNEKETIQEYEERWVALRNSQVN